MTKDYQRLAIVSKLFTEKTLKDILLNKTGGKNVSVTGWIFGDASAKGDSYLSTVDRITIEGIVDEEPITVKVVVKSLPRNLGRRKTFRSTDFFYNEIIFYSKIVPVFDKFIKSKNQSHLLRVPKCLSYVLDGENDFIVLEDVSVYGFGVASRQNTLSLAECKSILTGMGRFHGISFAHKDQHEKEFYNVADQLIETYFSENHRNWYKNFHALILTVAKDAVSKQCGKTPEAQKFMKINAQELFNISIELCGRNKFPTSVVNHGDAWAPNFLIRTIESTGEIEALLLDFQLARCASPVTDLSLLIYSCTDKTLRDEEFDNLLEFYHREVANTISVLGSDPEKVYSWKQFLKEVKEQFVHGFSFSLEAVPISMMEESEAFDLDIIKGDEAVDLSEIFNVKLITDPAKRQRLADVIMHAIQHEFI
ncbi:hypothetical protein PV325_005040 [Microctonus aethiopoides]|uniref:CHK kinase-like domain-containing protein n=1 Tax=Microctonus aethiopoides TaxID=144406 RepID=A0AA39FQV4_9HYME|nr:hypothetical protein PV325_005040 [Microctonus aethiopoides]KAK0174149.1 hypothetical protein PV328_007258 [Microctonus aethiopoides]